MNPERIWSWRMVSQGALILGTAIAVACSQKTVIDPVQEEIELVDIAVLPRVADLSPDESQQFQAQGVTQAGTTVPTTVRWEAEGGTIDGQGMFVAASQSGEFSVTATHTVRAWLADTVAVNITTAPGVVDLFVTPQAVTILVDDSTDFEAYAIDASGDTVVADVTWETDGGEIRGNGKGKGRFKSGTAPGRHRVIARESGGGADTADVTVSDIPVASVEVAPNLADIFEGENVQLSATMRDGDGNLLTDRVVTWSSDDGTVATVDGSGVVTGVVAGTANITATSEGQTGTATVTVNQVPVASVSVSPSNLTVLVGRTAQLLATPRDAAGNPLAGRAVTWSSSDEQVVTVDASGVATSVAVGSATITATSEGQSGAASFTASDVAVATVEVSPQTASLVEGESAPLSAITRDEFGNVLADRFVTWSSNDAGVATVDANGLVTAVGAGTATISAESEGQTGTATITVTAAAVASVDVTPSSATLAVGETVQLTATPRDAGGNALAGRPVTWTSSNTSVSTVNGSGLVTAVSDGIAAVTATSEGQTGGAAITVSNPAVASVGVAPSSPTVAIGQTVQLTATPRDGSGNALTGRTVTWSSGNAGVATVSGSGVVTGVAAGSAVITATSEGVDGTATVTVTAAAVASVQVTPGTASVIDGETVQLTATPRDAAGNALTGRSVTWSSGNTNVATVNGSGLVTARAAGSAVITATSEGVNGTATVTVSAAGVGSVVVTPSSAMLQVDATVQLSATVLDGAGDPMPGNPVTWSSSNGSIASVTSGGLVTANGVGSATIIATSEGVDGAATVTVNDGVRPDLAEPTYDPGNANHVLHFYDNFANYATPSEMEQTGTNPDRVGGTWTLRGWFNGGFDEVDPYTGEQSIRITYVPAGSERHNDGGISVNPPDYVNDTGNEEVVVIEYAYREVGQNPYRGKILDFNAGQNTIGRFDYNNGVAWEMGGTSAPNCASDPLCSRYYAGNNDGNLTPRFAGLPPEAGHYGGDAVRHVQLRTDGSNMPQLDPNGSVTAGYRQNRSWGMGAGQYDLMNNRDMRGQGNAPTQMPWMVIKIRFTKEAAGWSYGQGRIEHWTGETPGALTKVVEYLGDPGEFDEGLVFVGPRNEDLLGANVNVLWPQGIGSPPNTSVMIGYVRVWSHPRF